MPLGLSTRTIRMANVQFDTHDLPSFACVWWWDAFYDPVFQCHIIFWSFWFGCLDQWASLQIFFNHNKKKKESVMRQDRYQINRCFMLFMVEQKNISYIHLLPCGSSGSPVRFAIPCTIFIQQKKTNRQRFLPVSLKHLTHLTFSTVSQEPLTKTAF